MISVNSAISYFKDCYRLDTRTIQLTNFFSRKVEQRYLLTEEERLLTKEILHLPIPSDIGAKMHKTLEVYSKEKALYYCSLFVVGFGLDNMGKRQRICAPLFLYEANILKDEGGYSVSIDHSQKIVNTEPISILRNSEEDIRSLINSQLSDQIDFEQISRLRKVLKKAYQSLNTEELLLFPKLSNEKEIKSIYSHKEAKEGGLSIISASGLALFKRSDTTQGVMTELAEMTEIDEDFPNSIKALFGQQVNTVLRDDELGFVPALLNKAQQKIIANSRENHLSLVIGPPGTGKSFTIAALAIEYLSRGKSVLVLSKTDQAVDVVEDKIKEELNISDATVRAGKKDYLKKLKNSLEDLLNGLRYYMDIEFVQQSEQQVQDLKTRIEGCYEMARRSLKSYKNLLQHERRWGQDLSEEDPSFWSRLKTSYAYWLTKLKEPHWDIVTDYMHAQTTRVQLVREFVSLNFKRRIKLMLLNERTILKRFLAAIRARSSSKREELFSNLNFRLLFNAFPIWLCKLSDLHQVLPFKKELFDLVIIDEATQCDIASSLPAIYRGKKVVIVGDPKQLKHVSFLSHSTQYALQSKYELTEFTEQLNYRDKSILHFADDGIRSQTQTVLLNEHYRSLPDLIQFSNKHFYNRSLKMMNVIPEDHSESAIEHYELSGIRGAKGINEMEGQRIMEDISIIVAEDEKLDGSICRSIGLLSPFRNQVDYLRQLLESHFSLEVISKHKMVCGTAYSFQGEERDVMLLSFCLDNQSHSTGFNHFNRSDVFNVSVTRAKSRMKIYTSFEISRLSHDSHLRAYLEFYKMRTFSKSADLNVHDKFLYEVKSELLDQNFKVKVGYEVSDLSLDLVLIGESGKVAIDLIGYPGYFEDGLALRAYKVLHRAGIATFPLPYSFWKFDRERCLAELNHFISKNMIK